MNMFSIAYKRSKEFSNFKMAGKMASRTQTETYFQFYSTYDKDFLFSTAFTGIINLESKNTLVQFSRLPGTCFHIFKMAAKMVVKTKNMSYSRLVI